MISHIGPDCHSLAQHWIFLSSVAHLHCRNQTDAFRLLTKLAEPSCCDYGAIKINSRLQFAAGAAISRPWKSDSCV